MGSLGSLLKMIPGVGKQLRGMNVDDQQLDRVEAIILSMTPEERRSPELINGSRRARIAKGSGTSVQQINQLLLQHKQMKKMMKQMAGGKMPRVPTLPPGAAQGKVGTHVVKMRLARFGSKKNPIYRIVVADVTARRATVARSSRSGATNRAADPSVIIIDEERAKHWLSVGAQPSQPVRRLLQKQGIL